MAFPLEFIAAGGTIQFSWYTESGDRSLQTIQPQERSAAGDPFGFAIKATDDVIDCSLGMMSKAEATALQNFFDVTVDGMQKTFTYRDNLSAVDTTVRFAAPDLQITPIANNVYSTRFKLRVA